VEPWETSTTPDMILPSAGHGTSANGCGLRSGEDLSELHLNDNEVRNVADAGNDATFSSI
jgi:hypothetical protein